MQLMDRYLLQQYAQAFGICFCSFLGLYVVIDAFGHLDDFANLSGKKGGMLTLMAEYYAYRSIAIFDRISGVLALIAAMFTVTSIQRHNELIPLLAAGISKWRVITPIVIAALSISLIAAMNRELIIPEIRQELDYDSRNLAEDSSSELKPRYDYATNIFLDGQQLLVKRQQIDKPLFLLPPVLRDYGKHLEAERAFYLLATEKRPAGYLLVKVSQPHSLTDLSSLTLDDRPVVLMPTENSWLQPNQCFVVSDVGLEMLAGTTSWRQLTSTGELIKSLTNPSFDFGADVRVAIHMRIVQPLLDGTLLFLGLPLVVARRNRNMFLAIGLCLVVVMFYMQVILVCQYLGSYSWIRPALAAWLPLILFVPLAVAMSEPLRD